MTRTTAVLAGAQITQLCDHRGPGRHFPAIAPNGGYHVSHDRGAVTVGNEAPVWPSPAPRTATTTSSVTSRSDQHDHARLRLVTRFSPNLTASTCSSISITGLYHK